MPSRWHEELQRLQLAKRLAVQRWRLERTARQAELLDQQTQAAGGERHGVAQQGAAKQQQQQQLQEQEQEPQEQQRAAVAAWRRAREQQQAEEQRRQQAAEEERRQREAAARTRRQQENRQALEQHRRRKEAQAGAEPSPSAEGSSGAGAGVGRAALSPAALQRLQERSQQLLERRAQQVQRPALLAAAQAERVDSMCRRVSETFAAMAGRDPERLLRPTSAAAMRQLQALSEERTPQESGFIRHLAGARRATPTWCRGARLQ